MKTFYRNIKASRAFLFSGVFFGLLLINSVLVKGSSSDNENEAIHSSFIQMNQESSHDKVFQEPKQTLPADFLSILSSIEETEPTDESEGDETIESSFRIHLPSSNHNLLESSFESFNLSFQKRITIPFFLLHHSWKIPFVESAS